MKKYFVFVAFLMCNFSLFAQVQEPIPVQTQDLPDTVWTKNIFPEKVTGVMFSPDGSQVYVSTDSRVWIINIITGDSIRTVSGVGAFKVISSDNKYIYTSNLKKLDVLTFKVLDTLKNMKYSSNDYQIRDLCITPDNKTLIVAGSTSGILSPQNYDLCRVNAESMELIEHIDYKGQILRLAISPDGKNLVTDWEDGIWMSKDHTKKLLLWDVNTFKVIKELYSDVYKIDDIKFKQDNKYFCAIIGSGQIRLIETNTFTLLSQLPQLPISMNKFAISQNYDYVVTGSSLIDDAKTRINNISSFNVKYEYNFPGGGGVAISQNEKHIISGGENILALLNNKFSPTGVTEVPILKNTLDISPNPIKTISKIVFTNQLINNFNIIITDLMNKPIANIYNGYLEAGEHKFNFNAQSVPNGIYFCKVTGNNTNISTKIIVSK